MHHTSLENRHTKSGMLIAHSSWILGLVRDMNASHLSTEQTHKEWFTHCVLFVTSDGVRDSYVEIDMVPCVFSW